jgi:hypothetical protein
MIAIISEIIYLLVLVFNGYLLFGAVDGTRIVQDAEAAAGQKLTCMELYQARTINTYFDLQRPQEGRALYLFGSLWPGWLVVSMGVAFGSMAGTGAQKRWRWLPVAGMGLLVLGLVFYLPVIVKISCAIE